MKTFWFWSYSSFFYDKREFIHTQVVPIEFTCKEMDY